MGVTFPYHGKLPFECSDALHRQVPCYLKSASMSAVVETVDYVRWQLHLGRSYIDMPSRDPIQFIHILICLLVFLKRLYIYHILFILE